MNLPNKLTLLRIALIPFVILFMLPIPYLGSLDFIAGWNHFVGTTSARFIALLFFCTASLTDLIDGKIARARNLVTDFGKLFDPIADKLLVLAVYAVFVQINRIGTMFLLLVMAREFLVTGIRQIAASKGKVIAASMFGKWKTVTQMASLIWLLCEPILQQFLNADASLITLIGNILLAAALLMTIFSGYDYWRKNSHLVMGQEA